MSYQSIILNDSPVGFWPLNETTGTNASDLGSGGNDGTYAGSPALGKTGLVFEAGGVCPDFDGTNDRVSTPSLTLGTTYSIEGWFNIGALTGNQVIVTCGWEGASTNRAAVAFDSAQSTTDLVCNVGDDSTWRPFGAITAGQVHYFCVTFDGSEIRGYIDGVLGLTQASGAGNADGTVSIGTFPALQDWFSGKIQYIGIYTSVLTPLQIRKHYQAGIAQGFHKEILALNPTLYLPLNEASGDALDWSGNDNSGTLNGGVTQGAAGVLAYDSSTAYTFDRSNDYIDVGVDDSYIQNTGVFSIICLVKLDDYTVANHQTISGSVLASAEKGYSFHYANTGGHTNALRIVIMKAVGGTPLIDTAVDSLITDNEPHLIAVTGDATTIRYYVDGVESVASGSMGSFSSGASTRNTNIGRSNAPSPDYYLGGTVHGFSTLPITLTAAQVRTLSMAARTLIESRGYPKVISNLTPSFYARLGEASGTTVYDESGNDNDGTINGSPVLATADGPLHQSSLKAMTFDGVDDYVQTTYAGQTGSQNRTLLAWAKVDAIGAFVTLATYGTNSTGQTFGIRIADSGKLEAFVSGAKTTGDTVLSAGEYYLLTAVLNGTTVADIELYVNAGRETESDTSGGTAVNTVSSIDLRICRDLATTYSDAVVAEVAEIASALTAQQIKQIYEAGKSRFAAEVISYEPRNAYRFNEASGNLIDYGALGNDGTWTGSPTYDQTPSVITNESADKAIAVTASEEVAITSDISGTTYSFIFLGKPTAVSGTQDIFDDGGGDGFRLNGDKMSLFYSASEHDSDTALIAGEAHQFGVSVDAATVTFNLDGGDDGTASSAPLIDPDTLFDSSFAGDAGEAAIFDVALTAEQFLDIYEMASFSFVVQYGLSGSLTESLNPAGWRARAIEWDTGAFIADAVFTGGEYQIVTDPFQGPVLLCMYPDMGTVWTPSTVVVTGDRVYPTNPVSTNRYFECTTGGTTGASQPSWPTSGTVNDNGVVWTFVSDFVRPRSHGPLIPHLL